MIAKLTLTGDVVWERYAPMAAGVYAEHRLPAAEGLGAGSLMPTNFASCRTVISFWRTLRFVLHPSLRHRRPWQSSLADPVRGPESLIRRMACGSMIGERTGICGSPTEPATIRLQCFDLNGQYLRKAASRGLACRPTSIAEGVLLLVRNSTGGSRCWGGTRESSPSWGTIRSGSATMPSYSRFAATPPNGGRGRLCPDDRVRHRRKYLRGRMGACGRISKLKKLNA